MHHTGPAPLAPVAAPAAPLVSGATAVAGRLDFVDALRGIAALAVALAHALDFSGLKQAIGLSDYIALGHAGVMLFFLCSGFVIPISLERAGLGVFWLRRAFRLYPAYWASIALSLGLFAIGLPAINAEALDAGLALSALVNLSMLQGLLGVPNLRDLFWTLNIEMLFYLVVTLLFVLGVHRRSATIAATLLAGAAALELAVPALTGRPAGHNLLFYLAMMFVGTCFYRYGSRALDGRGMAAVVAGAVLGALVAWGQNGSTPALVAWLAALGLFGASFALRGRPMPAATLLLGQVSYSLYLLHWPVYQLLPSTGAPALDVAAGVAAAVGVAWAAYHLIERPAIELARRLTTARRL